MKIEAHIIVTNRGAIRMTKNKPALAQNEIAIKLNLEIPVAYFSRPYPVVGIVLPEPEAADGEIVLDLTAQAVASALKLEVKAVRDGLAETIEKAGRE